MKKLVLAAACFLLSFQSSASAYPTMAEILGLPPKADATFVYHFRGHDFPLEMTRGKQEGVFDLAAYGTFRAPCFVFSVANGIGEIQWLSTLEGCPVPPERSGTYLLEVASAIGEELRLSSIHLQDAASIECKKSGKTASLKMLKIYQNGRGWYESHGYVPFESSRVSYSIAVGRLKSIPMSEIRRVLPQLMLSHYRECDVESAMKILTAKVTFLDRLNEFEVLGLGSQLGEFMAWLWEQDCSEYIEVEKLLFSSYDPEDQFEWKFLSSFIRKHGTNLEKVLQ